MTVYGANQPVYTPQAQGRTSGWAIASLICGIFGFVLPCLICAIVFGILGRKEIARSNGTVKGAGLALAGLIISGMWILLIVIGIVASIVIPMCLRSSAASPSMAPQGGIEVEVVSASDAACRANLAAVNAAIETYYMENGAMPPTLQSLVDAKYISADAFTCAACGEGAADPSYVDTTGAYAYNAFTGDQSDTPRLWSKVAGHSGRASVLYATGSIDVVPPDILNAKLLVTADAE